MSSVHSFSLVACLLLASGVASAEADRIDNGWLTAQLKEGVSLEVLTKRLRSGKHVELNIEAESLLDLAKAAKEGGMENRDRTALLELVIDVGLGAQEKRSQLELRAKLIELLVDLDHKQMRQIQGDKGNQDAVMALTLILTEPSDPKSRRAAARGLGHLKPDTKAINALLDAVLDDEDALLRVVAAEALGRIGESKAVSYIIRGFQRYRDKPGSIELLRQLKYFKTRKSMEFLIPFTDDSEAEVRKAARETLRLLTGSDADTQEGWRKILRSMSYPVNTKI
jgi:HEAT repeat protein